MSEPPPSQLKVAGVVLFYIAAAIMMVTVNKWVLLSTQIPLFFLLCQLASSVALLGLSHLFKLVTIPTFDKSIARSLWPLIIVNVLGLTFNNYCLQYVDASFYQVARGLVLPITVALALVTGQSPPGPMALVCCLVVSCGFLVGVALDNSRTAGASEGPSMIGVAFGLLSSCTTAAHSVVIKESLSVVDGNAVDLAWYSNLLSAAVLAPLVLILGESYGISTMLINPTQLRTFLWGTLVTGIFGFLICIAGFLSIKVTSPVTHTISSAARGVIQTLLAIWLFKDIVSTGRISSILIITAGSCAYVWVKHLEASRAKAGLPPASLYQPVPREEPDDRHVELDSRKSP